MSADATFEFGPFRLDVAKRVLWRDRDLVPLTPKAFAVLHALLEARGDVVLKADLMSRVWPDTAVEEANLSVTVAALRRALGAPEGGESWVETVPRRGYRFAGPRPDPLPPPALAVGVLPFRIIGPDPEPHLGLGMAAALIARLTGVEGLLVRPTGAVARYATRPTDPRVAAEELDVDAVLDGTLQRDARRLRVAVQLVPRTDGLPGWAAQFEIDLQDVFAMQDELAEKLVGALSARLGRWRGAPAWATRRTVVEAWETWQRGCYFWQRLDADGVAKAVGCFGEAALKDPAWAPPHAGLAASHVLLGFAGLVPPHKAWTLAAECADRALELDPALPEAHLARAWVALYRDWAWDEALATLDRAVALGSGDLQLWRAFLLILLGDLSQARRALDRARETDPLSPASLGLQSFLHVQAGEPDLAIAASRRAADLRPDHYLGHWHLGVSLHGRGRSEEALAALGRARVHSGDGLVVRFEVARQLASIGRAEEARAALADLEALGETLYVSPFHRARVLTVLGEIPAALDALEQAAEERDPWVTFIGVDHSLAPLRRERRAGELVARVRAHHQPESV